MTETENTEDNYFALRDKIHAITNSLVEAFSDDEKKEKLLAILKEDDSTIDNLIKAAAAYTIINEYKLEYPGGYAELYQEMKSLFGNTVTDELKIQGMVMLFHERMFELLTNTPKIKVNAKKQTILLDIEGDLLEIMRLFPEFYFFDFLDSLIDVKHIKVEKKKKKTDDYEIFKKFQEIFSFNKFRNTLIEFLNVKALADLELEYMPVKNLVDTVYGQNIERIPNSPRGIKAFSRASELKNKIMEIFAESNKEGESLDVIEEKVKEVITEGLEKEANSSPNSLMYYLQNLLGITFAELVDILKESNVHHIPLFSQAIFKDHEEIEEKLNAAEISNETLEKLAKYEGHLVDYVNLSLDDYKRERISKGETLESLQDLTIRSMIQDELSDVENPAFRMIADDLNIPTQELAELLLVEVKAKDVLATVDVKSLNHLAMIRMMTSFVNKITNEVFLTLLMELTRHVARIMEFFLMLGNIKKEMEESVKVLQDTENVKPWKFVQTQEKFTQQIMNLQKNVAFILDKNEPYEVNAFILGKLCNLRFEDAMRELKEGNSPLYFGVLDHEIILDDLGIVSRTSALDILLRFQQLVFKSS
ncbi:MAG: hypothetical protein ACFFCS_03415 [Candidatus Hodarchaeota archaeon]